MKIFKKVDLNFNFLFLLCFIVCGMFFLHPKILNEFKDFTFFVWFILPVTIFVCALFMTFLFSIGYASILGLVLEIKKLVLNHNYLELFATLIGVSVFILMLFPVLKIIFIFFFYAMFDVKLNFQN